MSDAPQQFTPEYYERMRALEAHSWWSAGMRDLSARLLALAPIPERAVVLDVGCGSGQTLTWLADSHDGWTMLGLDVALDGLVAGADAGLHVVCASATDVPLPPHSVDLVIALDVLPHLPLRGGDVAALREMRRVLRPGGCLLVRASAQAFPYMPDDVVAQYRKYEPSDLREKLCSAGFEIVRMSRINAVLGLAEIPRELRAARESGRRGDHGILAVAPTEAGRIDLLKRAWLRVEGRAVVAGLRLPLGRSVVALCRAAHGSDGA